MSPTARGPFPTTHWSVIRQARDGTDSCARDAMQQLLVTYWRPLYAHLRHPRLDLSVDDAQDLVQSFCAKLIETPGYLAGFDRERGRFRHYIRGALDHFVLDWRKRSRAIKRGGDRARIPLDVLGAEAALEPASERDSPEAQLDRAWARTVLEEASRRTRESLEADGKRIYHAVFELSFDEALTYAEIATRLGLALHDVGNYLHRARKRFGECLIDVVLPTVEGRHQVREEIELLLRCLV